MDKTSEKPQIVKYEISPLAGGYKFRPVVGGRWDIAEDAGDLIARIRPSEEEIKKLGDRWRFRPGVMEGQAISQSSD
ncbi:hypothetical protein KKC08_05195 [Patescibacteria group bacterium]|nr:hypothetical protein [Patescibacteria group bacterium]MCG2702680.1 hypothetical protein [Candidatus Parcubacteria bacterium]MBU4264889.1 hypothetical protein [Patescibacteria group bacterium]MBU4389760.1 hypothetical protein [Patescibacteria group bacterium]MBU4397533.1 hypothetical protein [Patescibacteria group bacterium]